MSSGELRQEVRTVVGPSGPTSWASIANGERSFCRKTTLTKHQCRFHQMTAENEGSDDNASDSESEEEVPQLPPRQQQSRLAKLRPPPLTAIVGGAAIPRTTSATGLDEHLSISCSPHPSTPVMHSADVMQESWIAGAAYLAGLHMTSRSRTPVPYPPIEDKGNGPQGQNHGDGPELAGIGDQLSYAVQTTADPPVTSVMATPLLQIPAQIAQASGTYADPAMALAAQEQHQVEEGYYKRALEQVAASLRQSQASESAEHDVASAYQVTHVVPATPQPKQDPSVVNVVRHPTSTMAAAPPPPISVPHTPIGQVPSVYETLPYMEPVMIVPPPPPPPMQSIPYNLGRFYTAYSLGLPIDGFEIKTEHDPAYPLPGTRWNTL